MVLEREALLGTRHPLSSPIRTDFSQLVTVKQAMTHISEKFEQQVRRIHELVEQQGSVISWNDRIPDPDNREQSRQIDITIKREGRLTMVECRIHKVPQDVTWIEELMGRRLSLRADAAIAVSSSGFTLGAIAKAKAHGIILRDLQSLTVEEIQAWGYSTRVELTFFSYKNVEIDLFLDSTTVPAFEPFMADIKNGNKLYVIFNSASNALEKDKLEKTSGRATVRMEFKDFEICSTRIRGIKFAADFKPIVQHVKVPSVVAYDAPEVAPSKRGVVIEKVNLGDFEITQSSNRVYVVADLSPVKPPPNCQFRYVSFDFGRTVTMQTLEILRLPDLSIPSQRIRFRLIPRNAGPVNWGAR